MPRNSSRKSISVKGVTYQRLKLLCGEKGVRMSAYCEQLINLKLDQEGFRGFDTNPLTLWECRHDDRHFFVAARDESEAAGYVANVVGKDDIDVKPTTRTYDQKTLIPGILVPDEERSALTG